MPVGFLIVELISEEERDEIAERYGTAVIRAALENARALQLLRDPAVREAAVIHADWKPPTLDEMRREEEQAGFEKIMRRRQSGRLGSET